MNFTFLTRRQATQDEMAQGLEEMRREQERLAAEEVEERMQEQREDSHAKVDRPPIATPPPATFAIGTPSQDSAQAQEGQGNTEIETRPREIEDRRQPGEVATSDEKEGTRESFIPLFTDEQTRRLEELQRAAPLLMARQQELERPTWLMEEEQRQRDAMMEKEWYKEQQRKFLRLQDPEKAEMVEKIKMLEESILTLKRDQEDAKRGREGLEKKNEDLKQLNRRLLEEVKRISAEDPRPKEEFGTPAEIGPDEKIGEESRTPRKDTAKEDPEKKESPVDPKMMMKGMLKLMEGMQVMQNQLIDVKKESGMEIVRGGMADLPRLPDWKAETAPLDLTDWLLTIGPAMGDLSNGSQQWWEATLDASRRWYNKHQEKTPLERVGHKPTIPDEIQDPKFQRLEKRATALLMAAIPQTQQEEVIAGKDVSTMAVLCRLMCSYQPGGLSEKAAILAALDSTEEAQTLAQAVTGLRRWLRWHRRAGEVDVVRPDATIQVKGLGRLMKKVLKDNPDLGFRIQLAKSTLAIDTTPTEAGVMTYAHHLLAEVEQVADQDKKRGERTAPPAPAPPEPKLKKIEERPPEGRGVAKGGEGKGAGMGCKFFLTDGGCKKGKTCTFLHQLDDQKRCWVCRSTAHFAPKCDRPKDPERWRPEGKGEGKQAKSLRKEESPVKEETQEDRRREESHSQNEVMKGLLEEANRMLKSMSGPRIEERDGKLDKLQKQLDELKHLRVFRLTKIEVGLEEGLLDSGATHPLRSLRRGEDTRGYREIKVSLACGKQIPLRMSPGGAMVTQDEKAEPIVPLGRMVKVLRCKVEWDEEDGMVVCHPTRGRIYTKDRGGCPYVPKELALQLIEELEKASQAAAEEEGGARRLEEEEEEDGEERWIRDFVDCHPVLSTLPQKIKESLVRKPSQNPKFPNANKRRRKRWYKRGLTIHLYSGKDEAYCPGR